MTTSWFIFLTGVTLIGYWIKRTVINMTKVYLQDDSASIEYCKKKQKESRLNTKNA